MINYKYVYTLQIRQCFCIFDTNTPNVFFKELHPYQSSAAISNYNKEKWGKTGNRLFFFKVRKLTD